MTYPQNFLGGGDTFGCFQQAVIEKRDHARLDAVVTLLDVANVDTLAVDSRQLVQDQLAAADIVVLTKTDLVTQACASQVCERWVLPDQPTITAVKGKVLPGLLLDVAQHDPGRDAIAGAHSHLQMSAVSWETDQPQSYQHFQKVLRDLPLALYRAKGELFCSDFPDQKIVFHKVGSRVEFTRGGTWQGQPGSRVVGISNVGVMDAGEFRTRLEEGSA